MIRIAPLQAITDEQLAELISGYTTDAHYAVNWSDAEPATAFSLRLA